MPCKIDQCFRETRTFETNFVFITSQRDKYSLLLHVMMVEDTGDKIWAAWLRRLQCSNSAQDGGNQDNISNCCLEHSKLIGTLIFIKCSKKSKKIVEVKGLGYA